MGYETVIALLDKLKLTRKLEEEEYLYILENLDEKSFDYLKQLSREVTNETYGNKVYLRGLIEISNYCKSNCNYCGIRKDNKDVTRYRLSKQDILDCCKKGYELGYKTFVMQGGEDSYYTREVLSEIIYEIKQNYPDVAVTLSIGERSRADYKAFKQAGADRFLLRHESYSKELYEKLHPATMSYDNRIRCIYDLKDIGFQVGVGLMVDAPYQTKNDIAKDLKFIETLQPAMCGVGPYISHKQTPFKDFKTGDVKNTLVVVALVRLILPSCLLPATTALATIDKQSRLDALSLGANVVMPNLSPLSARKSYEIYEGKKINECESAQEMKMIIEEIENIGLVVDLGRGDTKMEGY